MQSSLFNVRPAHNRSASTVDDIRNNARRVSQSTVQISSDPEAPRGSGALITAAEARAIGRAVYAAPGPLGFVASTGTNELIASGRARTLTGRCCAAASSVYRMGA